MLWASEMRCVTIFTGVQVLVHNTLYGTALENDVDVGAVVQVVIVDVISEIPEDLLQASH